jgi:hypothetical protein
MAHNLFNFIFGSSIDELQRRWGDFGVFKLAISSNGANVAILQHIVDSALEHQRGQFQIHSDIVDDAFDLK